VASLDLDDDSSLESSDHSTNRSDAPMEFESEIVDSTEKKNTESKMTLQAENDYSVNSENGSALDTYFGGKQAQLSLRIGTRATDGERDIFQDPSNFSQDIIPEEASDRAISINSFLDDLNIKQVSIREAIDSLKKIESSDVLECFEQR